MFRRKRYVVCAVGAGRVYLLHEKLYDLQLQEADLYSDDNASAQAIRCDTFFRAVAKCMWCVL